MEDSKTTERSPQQEVYKPHNSVWRIVVAVFAVPVILSAILFFMYMTYFNVMFSYALAVAIVVFLGIFLEVIRKPQRMIRRLTIGIVVLVVYGLLLFAVTAYVASEQCSINTWQPTEVRCGVSSDCVPKGCDSCVSSAQAAAEGVGLGLGCSGATVKCQCQQGYCQEMSLSDWELQVCKNRWK